jgi:hypothetical protein
MRRFLLVAAVLLGLWLLVVVLRASQSEPDRGVDEEPPAPQPQAEAEAVEEPPADEPTAVMDAVAPVPETAPEVPVAPFANGAGDELQAEVIRLRATILERVERRPLFVMAEERHVPYFRLFFMTKPELLDAIMEAERVPPPDVLPSPETVARVRDLAAEAFRRHEEIEAEEAAQQAG